MNKFIVEYPATYDVIFTNTFKNKKLLSSLTSCIFNKEINEDDIRIGHPKSSSNIELKTSIFDVRYTILNKAEIALEMQKQKPNYILGRRLAYYLGQLMSETNQAGEEYVNKDCYVICLTDFSSNKDKCITTYQLINEEGNKIDSMSIILIDLTKIRKCANIELRRWLEVITSRDLQKHKGADKSMSNKTNEAINEAIDKIAELNADEDVRNMIRHNNLLEWERKATKEALIEEGKKQGLKEGKKQEKYTIAKNLKDNNVDINIIITTTGLTKEEVEQL